MNRSKKLGIVTCCLDDWGGSEELWARSIPHLLTGGIQKIVVYKNQINEQHPEFAYLKSKQIKLRELSPGLTFPEKLFYKVIAIYERIIDKLNISKYQWDKSAGNLFKALKADRPDLVLISQGINFDGLIYASQCLTLGIPYFIVCHKAVNFYWPNPVERTYMKEVLLKAEKCLFVSEHNRKYTEEQFGIRLSNSDIVVNPVKTPVSPLPYPSTLDGYKLACVGRLFVIDKGQDMLIRVLAKPKWKNRKITISLVGNGPDKEALMEMASLLQVQNIHFSGFNQDIRKLWSDYHALILPSRSEGLPLTIIEAMSLGRVVIATNAGGNNEIVQDQVTGFMAEANENDLDHVLECAWARKEEWETMGKQAAQHISKLIPENPEKRFAELIVELLQKEDKRKIKVINNPTG